MAEFQPWLCCRSPDKKMVIEAAIVTAPENQVEAKISPNVSCMPKETLATSASREKGSTKSLMGSSISPSVRVTPIPMGCMATSVPWATEITPLKASASAATVSARLNVSSVTSNAMSSKYRDQDSPAMRNNRSVSAQLRQSSDRIRRRCSVDYRKESLTFQQSHCSGLCDPD